MPTLDGPPGDIETPRRHHERAGAASARQGRDPARRHQGRPARHHRGRCAGTRFLERRRKRSRPTAKRHRPTTHERTCWKVSNLMHDDITPVFVISVAAQLSGLHPQTLRTYDRLGLVSPDRAPGRGRRYSSRDIEQLREVQRLSQEEGVNLAGIKRILELENQVLALQQRWPSCARTRARPLDGRAPGRRGARVASPRPGAVAQATARSGLASPSASDLMCRSSESELDGYLQADHQEPGGGGRCDSAGRRRGQPARRAGASAARADRASRRHRRAAARSGRRCR